MPGLVPGIHVLAAKKGVDGRDTPGHDGERVCATVACRSRYVAFFFVNSDLILSNNSIFAPFLRMITLCWITDSVLFQAQ